MSGPARRASLMLAPIGAAAGSVALPGSKSLTIRALLLAALCAEATELSGVLESDDTAVMQSALEALGVVCQRRGASLAVTPPRALARAADLFVGNSGLSARTLVAVLPFLGGHYTLRGVARMHERPIGDLVEALRSIGARIEYLDRDGFLPLAISPMADRPARALSVRGDASSQFLTGLLQAAPLLSRDGAVEIAVAGELISRPYVELTLATQRAFGVTVAGDAAAAAPRFTVAAQSAYRSPGRFAIEGDASSASYFLGLGALSGGPVRVTGVSRDSAQADVAFAAELEIMGATVRSGADWIEAASPGVASGFRLRPLQADLNHMPDAAMTLAVLALFASGTSKFTGIGSWRVKETDRLAAVAAELAKLGAAVRSGADFLVIEPPARTVAARIDTYDDHRMAMAFSLAACGGSALEIVDPECVAKTFPDYFERLAALCHAAGGR